MDQAELLLGNAGAHQFGCPIEGQDQIEEPFGIALLRRCMVKVVTGRNSPDSSK
jgi:hypothetical protein